MDPLEDVCADLEAETAEHDYAAMNTLWLALLKLANLEEGKSEGERMVRLIGRIPEATIRAIVIDESLDSLLKLEPPLETFLSHPRERLDTKKVTEAIEKVSTLRISSPREAMEGLGFVLKAIRNKREHGFKTRFGPRDSEILRPARQLLDQHCRAALQVRTAV
jgi:hypothetical protein